MANLDTEEEYFSPSRTSKVVNDNDDESEHLNKSDSDSVEEELDDEQDEDFSTSGGFIRKKPEKLRPNRSLLTWEELNRTLEVKFGTARILTEKPSDDDVNLVLDFQENSKSEDDIALSEIWLDKFQVAMDEGPLIRRSGRIESAKSPPTSQISGSLISGSLNESRPKSKKQPLTTTTSIEKLSSISAASLKPIVNASSLPNTNDAVKKIGRLSLKRNL